MAHLFPNNLHGSVVQNFARRSAVCCACTQPVLRSLFLCSFGLAVVATSSTPSLADAWLDRVERNLRRIESASKYKEPVGAGSPAAAKVHQKCIDNADAKACEQIIWRRPELLPIRDWAVGTAHVKRGEMREKAGDVAGAVEDYRDALGYHHFPSLKARIKRLSLREQQRSKRKDAARSDTTNLRHPIVVVEGWAPKLQDKNAPEDDQKVVTATEAKTSIPVPPAKSDSSKVDTSDKPSPEGGLVERKVSETRPSKDPAISVKWARGNSARVVSRFAPGSRVAAPPPAVEAARQVRQEKMPIPAAEKLRDVHAQVSETSPAAITTSALPDRGTGNESGAQGVFHWWAMATIIAMVLCSTLILMFRDRASWPALLVRQGQRKPVLSVEDLETLIKQRALQSSLTAAEKQIVPYPRPTAASPSSAQHSFESRASHKNGAESLPILPAHYAIGGEATQQMTPLEGHAAGVEDVEVQPVVAASGGEQQQAGGEGHGAHAAVAVIADSSPVAITAEASKSHRQYLDTSLLRRVSYGAAGLIMAGTEELLQATMDEKVDEARRPELMKGLVRCDLSEPQAAGIFNPFNSSLEVGDPLIARQRFNAGFEFYAAIFETIFGSRFVQDQKVMLRHMAMLLHAMPNPSLHLFYSCLENRRTLEPLHAALSEIDSVPTRLFFTTAFSSDEFDVRADYMRGRLAKVLSNERVMHLCGNPRTANPIAALAHVGRLIFLPLEGANMTPDTVAVLLRSMVAVLRMQSFSMDQRQSDTGVAVSIYIPDLAKHLGGSTADVDFFVNQLDQAGYTVL